ncbi:3441_t:CDS:10 [Ambispora leptoticha]|uniref:non-specific serine/threonine protein kinase n=1 Tax=Ambispora leptoticha TaxID=144679 RepID=A0A9N8VC63_9GLOM|nr:3441_t:CDS:10 [Ambispora leptoticha]
MGNNISSTAASIATAGIDSYVSELGDIQYEKSLSSARFMKTIRGRHKDSAVVVKIFIKPEPGLSLSHIVKALEEEKDNLSEVPNAFAYQRILETEKAGYLIRQYFFSSLYDRISTRPFLNLIEKKWITYQILCGVHDAHTRGIYHGDIKTENVLVTSWNWVYLADFAGYKPTYLPEDNPADFSFFFDTSMRRICYLAPERFYKRHSEIDRRKAELEFGEKDGAVTPAMDIFSLGCVIAELFLEGTAIFSLAQLFKYRSGEYDPSSELNKIEDADIRALVKHMINLDPSKRYTAEQYLQEWKGTAFPTYFYTFLHQYIGSVTENTHSPSLDPNTPASHIKDPSGAPNTVINTDADDKIDRIYHEFDKIAFFLGFYGDDNPSDRKENINAEYYEGEIENGDGRGLVSIGGRDGKVGERSSRAYPAKESNSTNAISMQINIPNYYVSSKSGSNLANKTAGDVPNGGALIFLSLICATIRNTAYPTSKLHALEMLLAIGQHLEDEFKLDRLVPYLIALLSDKVALVRANTVKTLTHLLSMVETITPSNAMIFPEYILPQLRKFVTDPEILVRMTYAQCISTLAETALRFLELTQGFKSDGGLTTLETDNEIEGTYEASYDANLHDLQSLIQEQVTTLLIDSESAVKRALLENITSLCIFFGRQKANDVLLSHMITYLNDRDWMLKCAFFESIIGVGTFVGGRSLEEYILPLMIQSLTDSEEFVVEKVLNSLTSLAELGLFQKMKIWELVGIISSLLCHPSIWIRYGAVAFISSASKLIPVTDVWCIVYPIIRPFLQADVIDLSEIQLLENIKDPLSRVVFDEALTWANKATNKSLFWKQARERKNNKANSSSLSSGSVSAIALLSRRSSTLAVNAEKVMKSEEDVMYLDKLRNLGMSDADEENLAAMRDYIFKLSKSKQNARVRSQNPDGIHMDADGKKIDMKKHSYLPYNVFLTSAPENKVVPQTSSAPFRLPGALGSKLSLNDNSNIASTSRFNSENNLQAQKQNGRNRRMSNTGQADSGSELANKNSGKKSAPVAIPAVPNLAVIPSTPPKNEETIPLNIPSSPSNAITSSVATPLREKYITLSGGKSLDGPKAAPATSTNTTTAKGTLERGDAEIPIVKQGVAQNSALAPINEISSTIQKQTRPIPRAHVSSTYEGNDRNVKLLLDNLFLQQFPDEMTEFGEKKSKQISPRQGRVPRGASALRTITTWRPEGTLVAHLTEHKGAINQICVSPDHNFFASGSDDGLIKIWDCGRLEKNVTSRSRLTYNLLGGPIKCMTFIDSTHSIAAASNNGSIHVIFVEFTPGNTSGKYGKPQTIREYYLEDEFAVAMHHYYTDNNKESILLYATSTGNICGLDLRTMQIAWTFENPKSHGVITAMVTDKSHKWLLVGTSRGIFTLWDLRFRIQLRSWVHPTKSRISKLLLHPQTGQNRWWVIIAAGKNEVSVWDIEKVECKEVYLVKGGDEKMGGVSLDTFKAIDPPGTNDILRSAFTPHESSYSADNSVRALLYPDDCNYMITAGSDRKIRFWDRSKIQDSFVISGSDVDDPKPSYSSKQFENITVHYESHPHSRSSGTTTNSSRDGGGGSSSNKRSTSKNKGPNGRVGLVAMQQQQLLKNHLDCINDIQITEVPYPMLITGDREGDFPFKDLLNQSVNCKEKAVKEAYHILCQKCADEKGVCAKCLEHAEISSNDTKEDSLSEERHNQILATLSERQRRTYLRKLERGEVPIIDGFIRNMVTFWFMMNLNLSYRKRDLWHTDNEDYLLLRHVRKDEIRQGSLIANFDLSLLPRDAFTSQLSIRLKYVYATSVNATNVKSSL